MPDQGPRRQYELILYAIKGKKPVTYIYPDVISVNSPDGRSTELFKGLLQRSVQPGDLVLAPFAGSGAVLPAIHSFKCKAVLIEPDPADYQSCLARLEKLK